MTPQGGPAARVALVGDRSARVRSHVRIPAIVAALRAEGLALDVDWVATEAAEEPVVLDGTHGIWLLPGSPYRSTDGAFAAVRAARERGVPFLGTCGGFQHALLEFARDVCGLGGAAHVEVDPDAAEHLIVPLTCSLVGQEGGVRVLPGSRAAAVLGTRPRVERYHCAYGVDPAYLDVLQRHGLRLTGFDDEGQLRIVELPDHPFFLATLFQPELADGIHPLVRAFAEVAAGSASTPDHRERRRGGP